MNRLAGVFLIVLASSWLAPISRANVIDLSASKDNTLIQVTTPTGQLSNGADPDFYAARTNQDGQNPPTTSIRRALIAFDTGTIPANSIINSVTLTLYFDRAPTATGLVPVALHKLLSAWGEGTSTSGGGAGAPATKNDATWLYSFYDASNPISWSNPGGDFSATVSATTYIPGNTSYGFYTWTGSGMVGDVQQWVNLPTSNFGWLLQGDESAGQTARRFASRENSTVSWRPTLTVDFTPVPEPASLALLALGGILCLRRRGKPI